VGTSSAGVSDTSSERCVGDGESKVTKYGAMKENVQAAFINPHPSPSSSVHEQ